MPPSGTPADTAISLDRVDYFATDSYDMRIIPGKSRFSQDFDTLSIIVENSELTRDIMRHREYFCGWHGRVHCKYYYGQTSVKPSFAHFPPWTKDGTGTHKIKSSCKTTLESLLLPRDDWIDRVLLQEARFFSNQQDNETPPLPAGTYTTTHSRSNYNFPETVTACIKSERTDDGVSLPRVNVREMMLKWTQQHNHKNGKCGVYRSHTVTVKKKPHYAKHISRENSKELHKDVELTWEFRLGTCDGSDSASHSCHTNQKECPESEEEAEKDDQACEQNWTMGGCPQEYGSEENLLQYHSHPTSPASTETCQPWDAKHQS